MRAAIILLAFVLAACGADGPPLAPQETSAMGLSVTGTVRTGMAQDGG